MKKQFKLLGGSLVIAALVIATSGCGKSNDPAPAPQAATNNKSCPSGQTWSSQYNQCVGQNGFPGNGYGNGYNNGNNGYNCQQNQVMTEQGCGNVGAPCPANFGMVNGNCVPAAQNNGGGYNHGGGYGNNAGMCGQGYNFTPQGCYQQSYCPQGYGFNNGSCYPAIGYGCNSGFNCGANFNNYGYGYGYGYVYGGFYLGGRGYAGGCGSGRSWTMSGCQSIIRCKRILGGFGYYCHN